MFLLLQIIVETGQIGRQASGSVIVRDGETVSISTSWKCKFMMLYLLKMDSFLYMQILYTSVCLSDTPSEPSDFFPMSVNYQERFSAAGRTRQVYYAYFLF